MNHVNHIYELSIEILEKTSSSTIKVKGRCCGIISLRIKSKMNQKNQIMQSPEGNIFHAKKNCVGKHQFNKQKTVRV